MEEQERKKRIYEIRKSHPDWTYQVIGELVGLSRQRVQQIVREVEQSDIINSMEQNSEHGGDGTKTSATTVMEKGKPYNAIRLNGEPISATEAARLTGIPLPTIVSWVSRGMVKVLNDPGQTGPGLVVLLDPVTLQKRIDVYRPKPRKNTAPA